jgi:hypothetical protein
MMTTCRSRLIPQIRYVDGSPQMLCLQCSEWCCAYGFVGRLCIACRGKKLDKPVKPDPVMECVECGREINDHTRYCDGCFQVWGSAGAERLYEIKKDGI